VKLVYETVADALRILHKDIAIRESEAKHCGVMFATVLQVNSSQSKSLRA
jgi:hypothetical protein